MKDSLLLEGREDIVWIGASRSVTRAGRRPEALESQVLCL